MGNVARAGEERAMTEPVIRPGRISLGAQMADLRHPYRGLGPIARSGLLLAIKNAAEARLGRCRRCMTLTAVLKRMGSGELTARFRQVPTQPATARP